MIFRAKSDPAFAEWGAWQEVCRLLKESGAVTDEDLRSLASACDTQGQKLFQAIREWGERLADLKLTNRDN